MKTFKTLIASLIISIGITIAQANDTLTPDAKHLITKGTTDGCRILIVDNLNTDALTKDQVGKMSMCLGTFMGVSTALGLAGEVCLVKDKVVKDYLIEFIGLLDRGKDDPQVQSMYAAQQMSGYLLAFYPCKITLDSLPKGERF